MHKSAIAWGIRDAIGDESVFLVGNLFFCWFEQKKSAQNAKFVEIRGGVGDEPESPFLPYSVECHAAVRLTYYL